MSGRGPMPCRFGVDCHRKDCWYSHPVGRAMDAGGGGSSGGSSVSNGVGGALGAAGSGGGGGARLGMMPGGMMPQASPRMGGDGSSGGGGGRECRYSYECKRKDCHFNHPLGKRAHRCQGCLRRLRQKSQIVLQGKRDRYRSLRMPACCFFSFFHVDISRAGFSLAVAVKAEHGRQTHTYGLLSTSSHAKMALDGLCACSYGIPVVNSQCFQIIISLPLALPNCPLLLSFQEKNREINATARFACVRPALGPSRLRGLFFLLPRRHPWQQHRSTTEK